MIRAVVAALCACAAWLAALEVRAEDSAQPAREAEPAPLDPPIADPEEPRPVPDYDGRDEPTTAGDVLIWVPRIALSPLWLVSELVVRRPLGFLISSAERAHVPEALFAFFTIGEEHEAGIIPIAFLDFGFDPSVGLYVFWDDAFVDGHDLRLRGATWGDDWLAARLSDRWALGPRRRFALEGSAIRRPDHVFYGIGPSTREGDLSRYGSTRFDVHAALEIDMWRASRFAASTGVRSASFRQGDYDEDPTLGEAVADGRFPEPYGYAQGYTAIDQRIDVAFDSRLPVPAPGSGVRIEANVEHEADVRARPGNGFLRWGGGIAGFYDLTDHRRVVSLALTASFADPLGDREIPFTELASVGGDGSMRGFVPGRLLGRSAAVASLHYRWPIWVLLDGSIQLSVGNVFGEHLAGFDPELLRFSGAIGIESVGSPDSSLEVLLGVGSETFESGGKIDSIRFAVGTNHGF